MRSDPTDESIIRHSGDDIIELVRENRNEVIKKLLKDEALRNFLSTTYQLHDVSAVKLEFIKRALKELMDSSVDLSHYGPLILEIRKAGSMIESKSSERYFLKDIERAVKNYL